MSGIYVWYVWVVHKFPIECGTPNIISLHLPQPCRSLARPCWPLPPLFHSGLKYFSPSRPNLKKNHLRWAAWRVPAAQMLPPVLEGLPSTFPHPLLPFPLVLTCPLISCLRSWSWGVFRLVAHIPGMRSASSNTTDLRVRGQEFQLLAKADDSDAAIVSGLVGLVQCHLAWTSMSESSVDLAFRPCSVCCPCCTGSPRLAHSTLHEFYLLPSCTWH
jgi:hypothetical protein